MKMTPQYLMTFVTEGVLIKQELTQCHIPPTEKAGCAFYSHTPAPVKAQ